MDVLHSAAAALEIVTYPESLPVASTRLTGTMVGVNSSLEMYSLTPTADLSPRWYALRIAAPGDWMHVGVVDVAAVRPPDGSYMVRFRPDSFPIALEILVCPPRDGVRRVVLRLSEAMVVQDGEPHVVLTSNGEAIPCVVVGPGPTDTFPRIKNLTCPAFADSTQIAARVNATLTTPSGARIQNVGTTEAPRSFNFVPAGLRAGNCGSYPIE